MIDEGGMIHALAFDGQGGGQDLGLDGIGAGEQGTRLYWVHLNRKAAESQAWLKQESGLDPMIGAALLTEDTRPRCMRFGAGLLLNLRGVNLNPGAEPEDMVSLRIWIDDERIITSRYPKIMAVQDLHEKIMQGKGPRNQGDFVVELAAGLIERMEPVISGLDDSVSALEEKILLTPSHELRTELSNHRLTAITLRRYISTQREALSQLILVELGWLDERHRARLREVVDRVTRFVEELDSLRERAAVIQDSLTNQLAERMNRHMYVLTVVAGIFLPLGLITGLLGINVGGIPGAETPWAFTAVCASLVALLGAEILFFRRLKWL